jgi:hypothetical protein
MRCAGSALDVASSSLTRTWTPSLLARSAPRKAGACPQRSKCSQAMVRHFFSCTSDSRSPQRSSFSDLSWPRSTACSPQSRPIVGFLFVEQRLPVCRYSSGWSGRGLIKRMRMRRGQVRTGKEFARSIIVKPPLACLETRDDRVASSCVVFRCMLIWRIIAAADVTTFGASAKMQPPTAGR